MKAITFDIRGRLSGYKGVKIPIKNSLLIMQNSVCISMDAWFVVAFGPKRFLFGLLCDNVKL